MSPSLDSLITPVWAKYISNSKKMTNGSGCELRIWEAQKHTDPDADSEHWYIFIILQREKFIKKLQNSRSKGFLSFFA
jgi:hypothetical protein